jgi:hypothetical protein
LITLQYSLNIGRPFEREYKETGKILVNEAVRVVQRANIGDHFFQFGVVKNSDGTLSAAIKTPQGSMLVGSPIKKDGRKSKSIVYYGPEANNFILIFFSAPLSENLLLKKPAFQQAVAANTPGHAVDGNTNGAWGAGTSIHTGNVVNAWWIADLGESMVINNVKFYPRTDAAPQHSNNLRIFVGDNRDIILNTPCVTPI